MAKLDADDNEYNSKSKPEIQRVSQKIMPSTFVDISVACANLCMEFHRT